VENATFDGTHHSDEDDDENVSADVPMSWVDRRDNDNDGNGCDDGQSVDSQNILLLSMIVQMNELVSELQSKHMVWYVETSSRDCVLPCGDIQQKTWKCILASMELAM
jgi:hypothetical protein